MANRLLAAGHHLRVYNRTRSKAESLLAQGAQPASSPADAARGAEAVVTMLADDSAVQAVTLGQDGLIQGLPAGAVHVSMSTLGPRMATQLASAHRDKGQLYVAAPVLGRPEAAERGDLAVVVAGPAEAIERCRPIFEAVGNKTYAVGEAPEQANVIKLAVNFLLAALLDSLGEAFSLVEAYGLSAATLLDIANGAIFKSPVIESYGRRIADRSFEPAGFTLKLGAKDARLVVEAGGVASVPMPIASAVQQRFISALTRGLERLDWSAVGRRQQQPRPAGA